MADELDGRSLYIMMIALCSLSRARPIKAQARHVFTADADRLEDLNLSGSARKEIT